MQPFEEFFNDILVLSLDRCQDRKDGVINMFENNGVEFYRFFKGVDYTEPIVQETKNNGSIRQSGFKSCVRCDKKSCSCVLPKNGFLDTEIANWLSFIAIFNELKNKKIKNALILEDDIVFTKKGISIMNSTFTKDFYKKKNINPDKPILIRIGSGYNFKIHESQNSPFLEKTYRMSNPAFFVNDKFVDFFLSNYLPISYTSDMFIHKKIMDLNPSAEIQHFSLTPSPIYELSWGSKKRYKSLIRNN